jgi:hypothetical protein
MRTKLASTFLLLLWCAAASAGDLKITGETTVDQYKLVRLGVSGLHSDAATLWEFDEDKLDGQEVGNGLLLTGPPGTYRVKVISILRDEKGKTVVETARTNVTIKGQPGPKPPPPPDPDPQPDDPLVKKLQSAYFTDFPADVDAPRHLVSLASVYSVGADQIRRQKPGTGKQLWDGLQAGATAAGLGGKLINTQKAVASELSLLKLKMDEKLTDARREEIAAACDKVATALGRVK